MTPRDLLSKLPPRGWAILGGAVFGSILLLYLIIHLAGQPSYTTILTNLNPSQTSKISTTLGGQGISYQIQSNGTAIAVSSSEAAQARVALAGAGELTGADQTDLSSMNKLPLGASSLQQQVAYQLGLEGQLAQTIDNYQGVSNAQVQLVLPNPQDQLFSDTSNPATAAVQLSGGGNLDPSQVRGIAQYVASSVQGLDLQHVTITDDTGQLLWPNADSTGTGGAVLAKQMAQMRYDQSADAQVNALLAQTLGPNKAEVQVNADLNANQQTIQQLSYTGKGVPLTLHTDTETLKGTGGGASTPSTAIPGYAATGSGNSNYSHKINDSTLGVNKTVTNQTVAPGAINRQSVAVLVDSSVPKAQLTAIKQTVSSALGLVPTRGDTISVAQMKFAPATTKASPTSTKSMLGYAKYVLLGLAALIFLFFITRVLRRREGESIAAQPRWLRELEHRRPLGDFEDDIDGDKPIKRLKAPPVNTAKRQVEDLVDREPERVAMQVRAWMAED